MVDIILEKMAETSDQDGAMAGSNAPGGESLNLNEHCTFHVL